MIVLFFDDAVIKTPSAPIPEVNSFTLECNSCLSGLIVFIPNLSAIFSFFSSRSIPMTLHPLDLSICAEIKPITPRP